MKNKFHFKKFIKFLILFCILALYIFFTIYKYGFANGILVSLTSWSFFALCTPIADAGFLIDFPVRLITGLKMIYSELIVWGVALSITSYAFIFSPETFESSLILTLFHSILSNLFPYGLIIVLSAIGTFFSVYFEEEILDDSIDKFKNHKKSKHSKIFIFGFLIIITLIIYYFLLRNLNISIPLF